MTEKGAPTIEDFRAKVLVILAQAMHEPLPTGYACRRITEEYAKALEAAEAERDRLQRESAVYRFDSSYHAAATRGPRPADD